MEHVESHWSSLFVLERTWRAAGVCCVSLCVTYGVNELCGWGHMSSPAWKGTVPLFLRVGMSGLWYPTVRSDTPRSSRSDLCTCQCRTAFFFFGLRCHFSEEKVVVLHHLSCKLSSFYISSVKQALVLRTTCCYFNKSTVTFQTYQDGFIMVQQLCFPHASRPPSPDAAAAARSSTEGA